MVGKELTQFKKKDLPLSFRKDLPWDTQKFKGPAWQFLAKLKLHEPHVQSETDYWKFSDAVEWTRHALLVQLYFIVDKFAICDFTKEAEWDYAWAYESEHEQPIDVDDL